MKVKVIADHLGEGKFPTFPKGTEVKKIDKEICSHFLNWWGCEINGYATYIPKHYVSDGKLTRDYNPTELVQKAGDILEVKEIAYAWFIATNEEEITGWIPAEVTVSAN